MEVLQVVMLAEHQKVVEEMAAEINKLRADIALSVNEYAELYAKWQACQQHRQPVL